MTWKTPAPLYRDPIYDGCSDPTLIFSREEQCWWMFYTQRRATQEVRGVSGTFGSAVGIASSPDRGKSWIYRGTPQGLDIDWGHNTFWAPEVFFDASAGLYRMLVTYIQGVPHRFELGGALRNGIAHFTSRNLFEWRFEGFLFGDDHCRIIDACVQPLPRGWRVWFRDNRRDKGIYSTDTADFVRFSEPAAAAVDVPAEGPNVFSLGGYDWLVTDPITRHEGLAVYRGRDLCAWERMDDILALPGERPLDGTCGRHPDIVPDGDRAWIFYFTQPYKEYDHRPEPEVKQSAEALCVAQCAVLRCAGGQLVCDRNEDFELVLPHSHL